MADDALAPAVRPGIVNGAGRCVLFIIAEELALYQGQVLAECKVPPIWRIAERGAIRHQLRKADRARQGGRCWVDHGPDIELVLRHIGACRDGGDGGGGHGFWGGFLAMSAASPGATLVHSWRASFNRPGMMEARSDSWLGYTALSALAVGGAALFGWGALGLR